MEAREAAAEVVAGHHERGDGLGAADHALRRSHRSAPGILRQALTPRQSLIRSKRDPRSPKTQWRLPCRYCPPARCQVGVNSVYAGTPDATGPLEAAARSKAALSLLVAPSPAPLHRGAPDTIGAADFHHHVRARPWTAGDSAVPKFWHNDQQWVQVRRGLS